MPIIFPSASKAPTSLRNVLYSPPMPFVLVAVAQEITMELFDVIFRDGNVGPGLKNGFHHLGITGDFLFVAAGETFDFQVGQQALHFPVGQLAALDAGGRADTLDGGNVT